MIIEGLAVVIAAAALILSIRANARAKAVEAALLSHPDLN